MSELEILNTFNSFSLKTVADLKKNQIRSTKGFTLIEVLVVVILIGVLSAIAAPGWLGFTQRQRVNKSNDAVLSTLREAQIQAKRTKLSYSVSLRNSAGVPQVAIYPTNDVANINNYWKSLGQGLDIKANQITVFATSTPITFDYMGNLKSSPLPTVTVSASQTSLKRCVIIQTIIGTMTTDQGANCPSS